MGKRNRQRSRDVVRAPSSTYRHDTHGELELRGALSPASRQGYAAALAGEGRPAATREDAWQRGVEFLFERLAVRWTAAGVAYERQGELLGRLRMAGQDERAWVRSVLREHLAEHFPGVEAP